MPEQPFTDHAMTVLEAAELLDVSDKTVRRMLEAGELIEQERDSKGRIIITAQSLNATAERLARERGDAQRETQIVLASQGAILDRALERHAELERAQQERIIELSTEIARLQTERQYMVSNDDKIAYEKRISELEALLSRKQENEAPKGWWARLLGQ